jgi:hypothetical protein
MTVDLFMAYNLTVMTATPPPPQPINPEMA